MDKIQPLTSKIEKNRRNKKFLSLVLCLDVPTYSRLIRREFSNAYLTLIDTNMLLSPVDSLEAIFTHKEPKVIEKVSTVFENCFIYNQTIYNLATLDHKVLITEMVMNEISNGRSVYNEFLKYLLYLIPKRASAKLIKKRDTIPLIELIKANFEKLNLFRKNLLDILSDKIIPRAHYSYIKLKMDCLFKNFEYSETDKDLVCAFLFNSTHTRTKLLSRDSDIEVLLDKVIRNQDYVKRILNTKNIELSKSIIRGEKLMYTVIGHGYQRFNSY